MKTLTLLTTLFFITNSQVRSQSISLIQECPPEKSSCELLKDYDSGKENAFHGSLLDRMTVSKADVKSAKISQSNRGSVITLTLKEALKENLAKLTAKSINKRLFITVDGSVISAPVVRESISQGVIMLTLPEGDSTLSEKLKWVKELSKVSKAKEYKGKQKSVTASVAWSVIILVGALSYSFFPRKLRKKES
jgi:hypothetical protein